MTLLRKLICWVRYLLPCRIFGHIKPDPVVRDCLFGDLCMKCHQPYNKPQPEPEDPTQ